MRKGGKECENERMRKCGDGRREGGGEVEMGERQEYSALGGSIDLRTGTVL